MQVTGINALLRPGTGSVAQSCRNAIVGLGRGIRIDRDATDRTGHGPRPPAQTLPAQRTAAAAFTAAPLPTGPEVMSGPPCRLGPQRRRATR